MTTFLVNGGLAIITARLRGLGTEPLNMGWGTGAVAASAASTDLSTPKDTDLSAAGPNRTVGVSSQVTTVSPTNNTYQVVATRTMSGAGPVTVTNLGLFDATTAGNLFVIVDGQSVALSLNDSIQGTFQVKFA